MPANKTQKNGFYCYMQELLPQLRREGRVFPNGMKDVVVVAHPMWNSLPPAAREKYERMARERKKQQRKNPDADKTRLDNQGNVIAFREDGDTEERKRRKQDRAIAKNCWPEATDLSEIKNFPFYFVAFEYLCETEDNGYVPCEMAIIEYTLQQGIMRTYHRFIQPGRIPLGYRFTCQNHSDERHQIPIENFELAIDDYQIIWTEIESFIRDPRAENPPLYCFCAGDGVNWQVTDDCMRWLHAHAAMGRANTLHKLFSLEDMVDDLYSLYTGTEVSVSSIQEMLATSAFDYESNTRCSFHEEKGVKYCALGTVKRYAFAISDALAGVLDFELTANHLPIQDTGNPGYAVIPPSAIHLDAAPRMRKPARSYGSAVESFGNHASTFQSQPEIAGAFPSRDIRYTQDASSDGSDVESTKGSTASSRSHWGAAPANPAPPSGSGPWAKTAAIQQQRAPLVMSEDEFPSLGGGSSGQVKFAGRTNAPPPNVVPKPDPWHPAQTQGEPAQRLPNTLPMSALNPNPPPITMTTFTADRAMAEAAAKPTLSQAVTAAEKRAVQPQPQQPAMPPMGFGRGIRPTGSGPRSVNSGAFNPGVTRKVNSGTFQPGMGSSGAPPQHKPTLGESVQQQSQNSNFSQPAWGSSIGAASTVPVTTPAMNGVQSNQSQSLAGLGRGRGIYKRGGRQASGGSGMATPPGFGRGTAAQAKLNSQMASMELNN